MAADCLFLQASASQNGNLVVSELIFMTVHSHYKDRYAYRVNMSDVVIQHLVEEEKGNNESKGRLLQSKTALLQLS